MVLKIKFTVVWCSLFIIATSQQPGNRAYWWSRWTITNAFFYQTIADFPRKNTWVLLLVIFDAVLDFGRCNARLRSANHTGSNASRFLDWRRNGKRKLVDVNSPFLLCRRLYLVAVQYFRHTSVWDTQLAWNLTWSHTFRGKLNDLKPHLRWKRPAVNEETAELIHAPLTGRHVPWNGHWTNVWVKNSRKLSHKVSAAQILSFFRRTVQAMGKGTFRNE